MMLAKFREQYPQGSLVGELVKIDRGTYIVKVLLQIDGIVLATALAGADTIEAAEDAARERAIAALILEDERSANNGNTGNTRVEAMVNTNGLVPNTDVEQPITPSVEQKPASETQNVNFSEVKAEAKQDTQPSISSFEPISESVAETTEAQSNLTSGEDTLTTATTGNLFEDTFSTEIPEDHDSSAVASEPEPEPSFTSAEVEAMDFNEIKQKTDIEIKRLGWTKDDGREFLKSRYGKRSRLHLTDEQLLEFLRYLEKLPNPAG